MKVAEVIGGVAATLRVRSTGEPFQPHLEREQEVSLVRSGEQTLLSTGEGAWVVEGATPRDEAALMDAVVGGLPLLAFVAQPGDRELVIETRRFTQAFAFTEPMQLGLDEKVIEDVRRGHGVGGTPADVAAWLEDRLLLPTELGAAAELRRLVISGDARGRLNAFRIHGDRVAADVRRLDDRLRLERVVRGGGGSRYRLRLLQAPVSIVDATVAGALNATVRTELSQVVAGDGSYLRIWQEYVQRERDQVLRRARAFGVVAYRSCSQRRDGGWSFHLAPVEDLLGRLEPLGEWDRFELEAGERPPTLGEEGSAGAARKPRGRQEPLSAPIVAIDDRRGRIDLAPPDDDDQPPRPPATGFLFLSLAGDEARLRRRQEAELSLRTGNCGLPQLGLLLEGRPAPAARRGKISVAGPTLKPVIHDVFKPSGPTQRQLEAIELAINTPDVCLIQGPPGTGKTKVITAIERCLAALADEGVEPSHRILVSAAQHEAVKNVVQRTEVFGIQAVKIGKQRGDLDADVDPARAFVERRLEELRARVRTPPEAERLNQARDLVLACTGTRSLPADQARRLRDLLALLDDLVPPALRDRALMRAATLDRPASAAGDPEEAELRLKAARGIHVEPAPFEDDGPIKARKALLRLREVLTPAERDFLERCAPLEPGVVPPWLAEGRALRDALIDRLTPRPAAPGAALDEETHQLLLEILDTVDRRLASTRATDGAAMAAYMRDLETDPEGVRQALEHYTVVLGATLQQAAGGAMRRARGIDRGRAEFETVIVDEAARAHPLDLFIPFSMAKRRAVLVGDHRQLPHMLEPDVERQIAEGVEQGTVDAQTLDAVRASLFERLWVQLRALEQRDTIRRTITLDAQHRMHPTLGAFVSREFYEARNDGKIDSPRPASEFAHALPGYLKDGAPRAAAWLDVPARAGREVRGASKCRPAEAGAIAREVRRLIDADPGGDLTFGVIAFYSAQVDEIGRAMLQVGLTEEANNARGWRVADEWTARGERLRVGTVDAFQGREFDVVFLSVTRSNDLPGETDAQRRRKYGHLMLENRLCVAMSRQKRLLVAAGDLAFVKADAAAAPLRPLRAFAELCGGAHGVVVP